MREACRTARDWAIRYIAVNVSAVQLRNPDFASEVLRILEETGLRRDKLEVEITETSFIENAAACRSNLQALRQEGVAVSLDDFGTGYSSFSHLNKFEVDRIKIDRSFVAGTGPNGLGRPIVRSILLLARSSRLKVTAEGVETIKQRDFLVRAGCGTLQGYLLAEAMPARAFAQLLTERVRDRAMAR
jgi:EAL domain-containing protein (putative c-di-GMP-specific phosphodiesterase class I)